MQAYLVPVLKIIAIICCPSLYTLICIVEMGCWKDKEVGQLYVGKPFQLEYVPKNLCYKFFQKFLLHFPSLSSQKSIQWFKNNLHFIIVVPVYFRPIPFSGFVLDIWSQWFLDNWQVGDFDSKFSTWRDVIPVSS